MSAPANDAVTEAAETLNRFGIGYKVRDWVVAAGIAHNLSTNARLTFHTLAWHTRADTGLCAWPTIRTLMLETGLGKTRVTDALKELREAELITDSRRLGAGSARRWLRYQPAEKDLASPEFMAAFRVVQRECPFTPSSARPELASSGGPVPNSEENDEGNNVLASSSRSGGPSTSVVDETTNSEFRSAGIRTTSARPDIGSRRNGTTPSASEGFKPWLDETVVSPSVPVNAITQGDVA